MSDLYPVMRPHAILAAVSTVVLSAPSPLTAQARPETTRLLSRVPQQAHLLPDTLTASPDGRTLVYLLRADNRRWLSVVIDDRIGPRFSSILGPVFDAAGEPFYVGGHDPQTFEPMRRKSSLGSRLISLLAEPARTPLLAPDGETLFAWTLPGSRLRLQRNETSDPIFGEPVPTSLAVTPDGQQWAYVVERGGGALVVHNGLEQPGHLAIAPPLTFSPDGSRLAYLASGLGGWRAIVDGEPGPTFHFIAANLVFSPDGGTLAYSAQRPDAQWVLVVNHQPVDGTVGLRHGPIRLSHDGKQTAVAVRREDGWVVVHNGQAGPAFDAIGQDTIHFDPTSSRLVYAAMRSEQWHMVVGGVVHDPAQSLLARAIAFSPDGHRFAYAAQRQGAWRVNLDGVDQAPVSGVLADTLTFSPDSRRFAYAAVRSGMAQTILDGQPIGPAASDIRTPVFSPDGEHLAWQARLPDGWRCVLDGQPSDTAYELPVPNAKPVFGSDDAPQETPHETPHETLSLLIAYPSAGEFYTLTLEQAPRVAAATPSP